MKTYKGKINQLESNQIFVFGSNPIGVNGSLKTGKGGAALFALKKEWVLQGERMDNCFSKSGKAYGLVTVSGPGKKRSKTPDDIRKNIYKLYEMANKYPEKEFLIAYTGKNNYNLNGYTNWELADMFSYLDFIPKNVIFEEEFSTLLNKKLEI
jgi:hypothetical protein